MTNETPPPPEPPPMANERRDQVADLLAEIPDDDPMVLQVMNMAGQQVLEGRSSSPRQLDEDAGATTETTLRRNVSRDTLQSQATAVSAATESAPEASPATLARAARCKEQLEARYGILLLCVRAQAAAEPALGARAPAIAHVPQSSARSLLQGLGLGRRAHTVETNRAAQEPQLRWNPLDVIRWRRSMWQKAVKANNVDEIRRWKPRPFAWETGNWELEAFVHEIQTAVDLKVASAAAAAAEASPVSASPVLATVPAANTPAENAPAQSAVEAADTEVKPRPQEIPEAPRLLAQLLNGPREAAGNVSPAPAPAPVTPLGPPPAPPEAPGPEPPLVSQPGDSPQAADPPPPVATPPLLQPRPRAARQGASLPKSLDDSVVVLDSTAYGHTPVTRRMGKHRKTHSMQVPPSDLPTAQVPAIRITADGDEGPAPLADLPPSPSQSPTAADVWPHGIASSLGDVATGAYGSLSRAARDTRDYLTKSNASRSIKAGMARAVRKSTPHMRLLRQFVSSQEDGSEGESPSDDDAPGVCTSSSDEMGSLGSDEPPAAPQHGRRFHMRHRRTATLAPGMAALTSDADVPVEAGGSPSSTPHSRSSSPVRGARHRRTYSELPATLSKLLPERLAAGAGASFGRRRGDSAAGAPDAVPRVAEEPPDAASTSSRGKSRLRGRSDRRGSGWRREREATPEAVAEEPLAVCTDETVAQTGAAEPRMTTAASDGPLGTRRPSLAGTAAQPRRQSFTMYESQLARRVGASDSPRELLPGETLVVDRVAELRTRVDALLHMDDLLQDKIRALLRPIQRQLAVGPVQIAALPPPSIEFRIERAPRDPDYDAELAEVSAALNANLAQLSDCSGQLQTLTQEKELRITELLCQLDTLTATINEVHMQQLRSIEDSFHELQERLKRASLVRYAREVLYASLAGFLGVAGSLIWVSFQIFKVSRWTSSSLRSIARWPRPVSPGVSAASSPR